MKKKETNILIIAIASVLLLLAGFIIGSFISPLFNTEAVPVFSPTPTPVRNFVPIEVIDIDEKFLSGKRWKLFADKLILNKEINEGTIYNVTCCFYEDKEQKITIESETADLDFKNETIIFNSKVRAHSSKGELLQVDKLFWSHKENLAQGEGNVRFFKDNTLVKADRIKADITLQTYDLFGNVEVIKNNNRRKGFLKEILERKK